LFRFFCRIIRRLRCRNFVALIVWCISNCILTWSMIIIRLINITNIISIFSSFLSLEPRGRSPLFIMKSAFILSFCVFIGWDSILSSFSKQIIDSERRSFAYMKRLYALGLDRQAPSIRSSWFFWHSWGLMVTIDLPLAFGHFIFVPQRVRWWFL